MECELSFAIFLKFYVYDLTVVNYYVRMSESTSKRSRKTKLEPRDYVDVVVENIADLQAKKMSYASGNHVPYGVSSAPTETHTYDDFEALIDSQNNKTEVTPAPIEFSITVAVEEFDESSKELVIAEEEVAAETVLPEPEGKSKTYVRINRIRNNKTNELTFDYPDKVLSTLVIEREEILKATNKILEESRNEVDKILGIEVRNCIGQYPVKSEDSTENKIQKVLSQWQDWQNLIHIKYRSSPLFYKCYICELSWWYLYDFQEHLKCHAKYMLDLEEYTMHEANLIAYRSIEDILDIKHFHTEGDCPKCGNDFSIHKTTNRLRNSLYSCQIRMCHMHFNTCFTLRSHEFTSHTIHELTGSTFQPGTQIKKCEVCGYLFQNQQLYDAHMNLMHTVRSDLVVAPRNKKCTVCRSSYIWAHECKKNSMSSQCKFCYRYFYNTWKYKRHMFKNNKYMCTICNTWLAKKCMNIEHLLKHSDNFTIVKQCGICQDVNFNVFLSEEGVNNHINDHLVTLDEDKLYKNCSYIILPKSCLIQQLDHIVHLKEEPKESILAPEFEIKQEVIDDFAIDTDVIKEIQIKEEIDVEDNFNSEQMLEQYNAKLKESEMHSKIFGIKIEPNDIVLKQETQEDNEESEYEDDIIKLDFNYLGTMQNSIYNPTEQHTPGVQETDESMQISGEVTVKTEDFMEDTDEDMLHIDEDTQEDTQEDTSEEGQEDTQGKVKVRRCRTKKLPKIYRCSRCGFDAVHREYRAHLKSDCQDIVYVSDTYKCTKCSNNFNSFEKFIDHFSEHNLRPMSCPECFKTIETYELLQSHITTHVRMTFVTVQSISYEKKKAKYHYRCKLCDKVVERPQFFVHWEQHLSFPEHVEEKVMEQGETLAGNVEKDMLNQLIERLQSPRALFRMRRGCPICLRYFVRKNDYKRHLIEHLLSNAYSLHTIYKGLRCQICGTTFQKPEKYKQHMRDHGSLPAYRCDICDKSFSDSSNYAKHKKVHNINAFTCDICKKKFQIKATLEKHLMLHETQGPLECVTCNKTFFIDSAYKKHMRLFHQNNKPKFGCKLCNKKFFCLKDKWDHLWDVHKQRKYMADCPKCDKRYRRFRDLLQHMKRDHGTKLTVPRHQRNVHIRDVLKKQMTVHPVPSTSTEEETLVVFV